MRRQLAAYYLCAAGGFVLLYGVSRWVYTRLDGQRLVTEVERHLIAAEK